MKKPVIVLIILPVLLIAMLSVMKSIRAETNAGWVKYDKNPVLGGDLGVCFDITMLQEDGLYKIWFSWRPKKSIAYAESKDGIHWSKPKIVLSPVGGWEQDLNRPSVIRIDNFSLPSGIIQSKAENTPDSQQQSEAKTKKNKCPTIKYVQFYTGQADGRSRIGMAVSTDGINWKRVQKDPVLASELPWEKVAVMCPHAIWDNNKKIFRLWYSAGEQYEPNAIGYAESPDGIHWKRAPQNPIFKSDPKLVWEQHKVTAAQILPFKGWFYMFYIGFENEHLARIGIARSKDGISNWIRLPENPIIGPGNTISSTLVRNEAEKTSNLKKQSGEKTKKSGKIENQNEWDGDACYKPFVIFNSKESKFRLWYNGRKKSVEQIGLAWHDGEELGFDEPVDSSKPAVLNAEDYRHYIEQFNRNDDESVRQLYPNSVAWKFLSKNIPLLDYPEKEWEKTYYFRWWTFRKHLKKTQEGGYVITEFHPNVPWAGKENAISCPGGHHFREGRWLHNQNFLNEYARFWLQKGGALRSYSFWIADSMKRQAQVTGKTDLLREMLPDLVDNYQAWEKDRLDPCGLFWQIDDRDGMEVSIGGSGYRATINTYMFADALAIAETAQSVGKKELAEKFRKKADQIKSLINSRLWDSNAKFYKVAPRIKKKDDKLQLKDVREEHGFTPWYADALIPPPEYSVAWNQLLDPKGFFAPFGPTTAEQRHSGFKVSYEGHPCQWNGPSWPFATSITLTGLANLINRDSSVGRNTDSLRHAWLKTLGIYLNAQRRKLPDGRVVPWIDENLNPFTGDWIARTRLEKGGWTPKSGGYERGKDYNHSTCCDLIISGLIGLRPETGNSFHLFPLVERNIEYFCLDNILYHGKIVTIFYDKSGNRYKRGKGLYLLIDGKEKFYSDKLPEQPVKIDL